LNLTIVDAILGGIEAFEPLFFHGASVFLFVGIDEASGTSEELVFGMELAADLFDIFFREASFSQTVES
jgi:hypothetical protein